jgi:two-component system response regulator YesN
LGGSAFYTIDGVERKFQKGYLYVFPADKVFSLRELKEDKFHAVFIHAYTSPKITSLIEIDVSRDTFLSDVISMIRKYISDKQQGFILHLTNLLVAYVCGNYLGNALAFHAKIKAYIEENFLQVFKGYPLARQFNYSTSHITKIFRDEYNLTPKQYATQLVLQRAVFLLHEDMSIKDIAQELRFSSPENFSRFFKNFYGCGPSEYRKNHREFMV